MPPKGRQNHAVSFELLILRDAGTNANAAAQLMKPAINKTTARILVA